MTSRTASGTKLLDGLEEHHCKVGVLLASQQDAPTACLMAERPSRKFHRCLSPGAPGRGAARNFLFQPVPPAASGGRGWRGYDLCGPRRWRPSRWGGRRSLSPRRPPRPWPRSSWPDCKRGPRAMGLSPADKVNGRIAARESGLGQRAPTVLGQIVGAHSVRDRPQSGLPQP